MDPYREYYESLANAIIIQAAEDWRHAVRDSKGQDSRRIRKETETFFLSDWFQVLTNVDGQWMLNRLKQEAGID